MQIKKPLDFAVFPSLILIATLFRLALNVSSTRLVLTDGYAGKVIEAFGHFVIGGSLVVGLVIFVILTIIQFVDRKSTRLNSSHANISYAVFCLKKKNI